MGAKGELFDKNIPRTQLVNSFALRWYNDKMKLLITHQNLYHFRHLDKA